MQAYRFEKKAFARGALVGDPLMVSAFGWFRTDDPKPEQYFLCLGGGREGIRALGVKDGCVTAATGSHGGLRYIRTSDPVVSPRRWTWACASWRAGGVDLYVGSKLNRSSSVPLHIPGTVWWAGCMGGFTGERYFSGDLARWGWVSRLLPPSEILMLSNRGDCPVDTQPESLAGDPRNPTTTTDDAPVPRVVASGPVTGTRRHSRRMG